MKIGLREIYCTYENCIFMRKVRAKLDHGAIVWTIFIQCGPYSHVFKHSVSFITIIFPWPQHQICYECTLTLFRMGFFGAAHGWGEPFSPPSLLPKICFTYPAMMKLGTFIPYLRKIQKMYKSHDTSLEFCWHQHFFTENRQILLHQELHI